MKHDKKYSVAGKDFISNTRSTPLPEPLEATGTELFDGVAMSEFPENITDITLELKQCLEYCKQQNGRDSCKNCGLDYDMLDHIHYLVGEEVKKAHQDGYDEGAHESSMVCNEHTVPMAVKLERTAWLAQERCNLCGNEKKADGLSDTCITCYEEA